VHVSFFMALAFVFICEALRWVLDKEFFIKNIYAAGAGIIAGCLIHPNFPNNLFSCYLNGILVPLYGLSGTDLGFASEMQAFNTKFTFINNFSLFFSFNLVLWVSFLIKRRVSLATSLWLTCTSIFLFLAFFANRYWYQANVLFFIFFASYANDSIAGKDWVNFLQRFKMPVALFLFVIIIFFAIGLKQLKEFLAFSYTRSRHFENVACWMQKNIPPDQTIYHSYWTDSPYFICLNPKDNYLNALDPIYMFYRYPQEFNLLKELSLGRVDKPAVAIGRIFRAKYGYVNKFEPLYRQMLAYPGNCKLIYENDEGAVFKILTPPSS